MILFLVICAVGTFMIVHRAIIEYNFIEKEHQRKIEHIYATLEKASKEIKKASRKIWRT